jgi:hypothetical protein
MLLKSPMHRILQSVFCKWVFLPVCSRHLLHSGLVSVHGLSVGKLHETVCCNRMQYLRLVGVSGCSCVSLV